MKSMKKLAWGVLLVCMVLCMMLCAVGCGHGAEVRYRYYSEEEGGELVTTDFSEFEINVDRTLPVMIVYTPDYDPYDDRDADNAEKKEYYQSKNQTFLDSTDIDPESKEYKVTVYSYSPTVIVVFETYSEFEAYRAQFVEDMVSNKLLRSILVANSSPLVDQGDVTTVFMA